MEEYVDTYFMHNMMRWFIINPFYMMIGIGIYFLVSSIIAYAIYKDSLRKGLSSAGFWFFIILLFSVIGLVFYFIFREPFSNENKQISRATQSDHVTSQNMPLNTEILFCPQCGKRIPSYSRFCPECGASIE